MKWRHPVLLASVVALSVCSASAQEPTRLQFEVTIDGSLVARPELRVQSGGEGRLDLNDDYGELRRFSGLAEKIILTPTVSGDDVAIAFNITSGEKEIRPSLVISRAVRGSLEWTSGTGAHTVRLSVSWVQ